MSAKISASSSSTAAVSWQVQLAGEFKPYEEAHVHEALEAALAGSADTVEVKVRGTAYIVHLKKQPMKQVQKHDESKSRQVRRVGPPATGPAPSAAPTQAGEKRKHDAIACVWSDPIELMDGLSYRWMMPTGESAKNGHGHGDDDQLVEVEFFGTRNADGSMGGLSGHRSLDCLTTRGYIGFKSAGGEQYLLLKINDEVLIPEHLGEGYSAIITGDGKASGFGVCTTRFRCKPGAVLDFPSTPILLKLDSETAAVEAETQRLTALQHPRAFAAFLDQHGSDLAVELTTSDVSNKATYADLTITTPGGTAFALEARMGGVFMSERRLKANLQANKVTQLREIQDLGVNGRGTYCRIRLVTQGADLEQIGPEGFQIRAP